MARWDPSRFLNTVGYFGAIPIFSGLQRWLTGESNSQLKIDGERSVGVVLVIDGISDIGQLIVGQLLKSGYAVRAGIADLSLKPFSVPDKVEFVQVDINSLNLSAQIMTGVRSRSVAECKSIIICSDLPEYLSATAIANLTTAAQTYLPIATQSQLFDFTQTNTDLQKIWGSVDDVVMGGVSESGIRLGEGFAVFSGNVSTDNSGGFASVRTRNFDPNLNLSNYQGIELRVKGDGQRYKFFVRTEATWDGVGYAYSFDTVANEWLNIQIPFDDLVPIFRAKTVSAAAPIDPTQICSFQLMLSKFEYDRALNPRFNPGLFSLQIESISAYGGQMMPQVVVVVNSLPLPANLVANLQAANVAYSIVQSINLDLQMVAICAVKSLTQPEAIGQILGR